MDIRIICVGTGAAGDSAHLRAFVAAFHEDGSLHPVRKRGSVRALASAMMGGLRRRRLECAFEALELPIEQVAPGRVDCETTVLKPS